MTSADPQRPGPVADEDSAPFWEALREHRVLLQKCAHCAEVRFPPMPGCPFCGSHGASPVQASGRGRIYSWITVHRPVGTLTKDELPATIVTVELEEGCRMLGRLIGASGPAIDLLVAPRFMDHDGWTELAFVVAEKG